MLVNAYTAARSDELPPQERNRQWWERLPMTYEAWQADDRSTNRARVISKFLASNPYLTRDYFTQHSGKRVLEIGCGAGPATCLFAEAGAQITAIDLTQAAVDMTGAYEPRAVVSRMDAEAMTFDANSFDHVFSWGVLHHSASSERAFSEIARVLRPGGTALLMVYNRASLRYWIKGGLWLLLRGKIFRGENFSTVQRFFTDGYFHRHFTSVEMRKALAPLKTQRIDVTHMAGRMLPLMPHRLDERLKTKWGWLLVARCVKL